MSPCSPEWHHCASYRSWEIQNASGWFSWHNYSPRRSFVKHQMASQEHFEIPIPLSQLATHSSCVSWHQFVTQAYLVLDQAMPSCSGTWQNSSSIEPNWWSPHLNFSILRVKACFNFWSSLVRYLSSRSWRISQYYWTSWCLYSLQSPRSWHAARWAPTAWPSPRSHTVLLIFSSRWRSHCVSAGCWLLDRGSSGFFSIQISVCYFVRCTFRQRLVASLQYAIWFYRYSFSFLTNLIIKFNFEPFCCLPIILYRPVQFS